MEPPLFVLRISVSVKLQRSKERPGVSKKPADAPTDAPPDAPPDVHGASAAFRVWAS